MKKGIAGIIDFLAATPQEDLLRRMLGLIRHRGPMHLASIWTTRRFGTCSTEYY
jgi:asparagine synthetase B (glutamine-hydrolysing)